jgi:hypothetical protein
MKASASAYGPAIQSLLRLKTASSGSATDDQMETIREITRRLDRLEEQFSRLMELNNSFIQHRAPTADFDNQTDIITFTAPDLGPEYTMKVKLKRADPTKPIRSHGEAIAGSYQPEQSNRSEHEKQQERLLENWLEDYYRNAHRVLKLVETLPGLKNFTCRPITIVRNHLIEHPKQGEIYSFGFGSTGPVVRPMYKPDREHVDAGLVPNTQAFVTSLTRAFENAAGSASGDASHPKST